VGIGRWLRHAATTPRAVPRAFPPSALEAIGRAVHEAEAGHDGEIRFAVESALPWSYLRRHAPARQRAMMVFAKLRVWDTERNNGVLVYVELADRAVEIVADRGIARHVEAAEWSRICEAMREAFRAGRFEQGAVEGVRAVGALLSRHFPLAEGVTRGNELPDRPAVLG